MPTIPATQIVTLNPSVLAAAGAGLALNGVFLTASTRPPINDNRGTPSVLSFPSPSAVQGFFGAGSIEATLAPYYFGGFANSNIKPGAMLFAQYSQDASPAYLRSGNLSAMSLQQLQALSGSLTVAMDGIARAAASINLSSASSFSAGAALIQTGLNASPTNLATVTGSIAAQQAIFTGSIAGNILTVTGTQGGIPIVPGAVLNGTGVSANTVVQNQLTGASGSAGTYAVSVNQVCTGTVMQGNYGLLTVSGVANGTLSVGQTLAGTGGGGVTANTVITALGTGGGLTGTYYVTPSQSVTLTPGIAATPTPVVVSYDSVSGAFVITSGIAGAASMVAFATGTLAASLLMTSATGAVLSQGAPSTTPGTFMTLLTNQFQNFATFVLEFDPDDGVGNVQKMAFSTWNGQQNNRYAFICWDPDASPTASVPASSSMGQLLAAGQTSGTSLIESPATSLNPTGAVAAFVSGAAASIDFTETNGRITFAFKSQSGLFADVTDPTIAINLAGAPQVPGSFGNNYNFYGAYGTAAENFVFLNRGTVSGPFQWLDSYINQIWLNQSFLLDLMLLLTQVKSIPYNPAGYSLVEAALMDTITQAVTFGAIRQNVTLSSLQVAEVNAAAGKKIDNVLSLRGWYLQVLDATPAQRQARASPPATFWYMDGESIQAINLASILLQ